MVSISLRVPEWDVPSAQTARFRPRLKEVGNGRYERLSFSYALSKVMRFEEALSELLGALEDYPNALYPRIAIANIFLLQQRYKEAIQYCHQIIQLDPLMAQGPLRAAGGYTAIGFFAEAEKYLQLAIELDPQLASVWLGAGQLNFTQQKEELAIECFRKTLVIDDQSIVAYLMLAEVYEKQLNLSEAAAYLERAIALKPRFLLGHSRLGRVYVKQRKYALAKRAFYEAIALDANSIEPRIGLAQFWIATGRVRLAEREFETIQKITQKKTTPLKQSSAEATPPSLQPDRAELRPIRSLDETCDLNLLIYSAALSDQERYLLE